MDSDRARELLAAERARVEQALASLSDSGEVAGAQEPGERDSEGLYQKEFDTGLAGELAEQLAAVERAEARLQAGTYGVSVDSRERIPDERLEVLPTAERTVAEEQARG